MSPADCGCGNGVFGWPSGLLFLPLKAVCTLRGGYVWERFGGHASACCSRLASVLRHAWDTAENNQFCSIKKIRCVVLPPRPLFKDPLLISLHFVFVDATRESRNASRWTTDQAAATCHDAPTCGCPFVCRARIFTSNKFHLHSFPGSTPFSIQVCPSVIVGVLQSSRI